jgi:3-isopropylmalate dehydratase small subunit
MFIRKTANIANSFGDWFAGECQDSGLLPAPLRARAVVDACLN